MGNQKSYLETPVLFLIFNRLDTTKKVFEEIRKARPKQLFIAADGPRNKEEKQKTNAVRKYVLDNIDWKCEIKTLFREKNLGCKYAVSGAIDWFFENVEQGIILEDDCLPSQSFFRFCQELLERYKNCEKIMDICGQNILCEVKIEDSYYFSKYFYCWGWATWRRAWNKRDINMNWYKKSKTSHLDKILPRYLERLLFKRRFDDNLYGRTNSWAITFLLTQLIYNGLSIIPRNNLVENIGFSNLASTHTSENRWDKKFLYCRRNKLDFPLKHPKNIKRNLNIEKKCIKQDLLRVILKKLL